VRRIGARRMPSDQLRSIGVPVTLVWGRGDRLMRIRNAESASTRFGWPLHAIDDCAHGPHIERPGALLNALAAS
jgi:pimeloyl-ACP methyl ester carboxylesterase